MRRARDVRLGNEKCELISNMRACTNMDVQGIKQKSRCVLSQTSKRGSQYSSIQRSKSMRTSKNQLSMHSTPALQTGRPRASSTGTKIIVCLLDCLLDWLVVLFCFGGFFVPL